MYYPFYIFALQAPSSVNELIFYTRGLDQSGRTIGSSSGWLHHLAVRLLDAHFYSVLTSLLTNWLDYSVLASSPTS
jgi:hypothetical protein